MRVFLAGATGAIGRRLVPLLVERGHQVFAITRDPDRAKALTSPGVTATVCDVFDRAQLRDHIQRAEPDIIVNQLTSIPPRINPRRIRRVMEPTNRLRIEGTDVLVTVGCQLGVSRFLSQSIAFAYAPGSGLAVESEPLYVDAPRAFAPLIQAAARCEEITMGSPGCRRHRAALRVLLRTGHSLRVGRHVRRGRALAKAGLGAPAHRCALKGARDVHHRPCDCAAA